MDAAFNAQKWLSCVRSIMDLEMSEMETDVANSVRRASPSNSHEVSALPTRADVDISPQRNRNSDNVDNLWKCFDEKADIKYAYKKRVSWNGID